MNEAQIKLSTIIVEEAILTLASIHDTNEGSIMNALKDNNSKIRSEFKRLVAAGCDAIDAIKTQ
ncbi:MAG TPA: hypothetical protein EYP92_08125 [Candidatus Thioglobus sp.]|jgi:hypothetical protein|nr:hypothetical protein [Candidatus Thioglobus sp.]